MVFNELYLVFRKLWAYLLCRSVKVSKKAFFHWVGYLLIKAILLGIKKMMEFKRCT